MKTRFGALAALVLSLAAGGCHINPLCLDCIDASSHPSTVDRTYDLAGTAVDMEIPADLMTCNPMTVDSDPNNCGACGNQCPRAHAIPACVSGTCQVGTCDVGWVDLDGNPANDCEYMCLITGSEVCDGKDNDCNGIIDDGFDLMNDAQNCGACGNVCALANGVASCVMGTCTLAGCDTGYRDLDPNVPGCEYRCPVYPPLPNELCNGLDDNCDGVVDEPANLEAAPTSLCVTRANTPCAGTVANCEDRNGVTTWYCDYGAGVEADPSLPNGIVTTETKCDGIDGNCDGQIDESFGGIGNSCDNGLLGACRDAGQIKCMPGDTTKTFCDLSVLPDPVPGAPSVELCNNVDDDCDGTIDNTTVINAKSKRLVRDMVHVTSHSMSFWIDRYEASRPDATAANAATPSAGVVSARSCSNANALPWTSVSETAAQTACAAAGMRLCSAAEWGEACSGASSLTYPYGATYVGSKCNGVDFAATAAISGTGDPSLSACVTGTAIHDLSGNAKEWTSASQGTDGSGNTIYTVRGGSYESPSGGLTCTTTFSNASSTTVLPDIGFRCCSSTAP